MAKILVIDDDESILEVVAMVLESDGYEVITSPIPDYLKTLTKSDLPDLIFLDILLSGADGRDVCRSIRENSLLKDIPVIMFSAHTGSALEASVRDCGADNFLPKPFDIDVLLAVARKHIHE